MLVKAKNNVPFTTLVLKNKDLAWVFNHILHFNNQNTLHLSFKRDTNDSLLHLHT